MNKLMWAAIVVFFLGIFFINNCNKNIANFNNDQHAGIIRNK